jgi:tetratricopeptide (TPR) repeat protein
VRAFVEGQAAYRQGRWSEAIGAYREALQRDSTFALAALGAASAAAWIGDHDTRVEAEERAWMGREQLSPADRAYLDALVGPKHPDSATTERRLAAWETASRLAGDRPEVWFELGDEYFHNGAVLSREGAFDLAATAFERALGLMPDYSAPLTHLIQIRALQRDTAALRSLKSRLTNASGEDALFARWRVAVALGDSADVQKLRLAFANASDESLRAIAFTAMEEGIGIGDANRALQTILARSVTTANRRDTYLGIYALALIEGDHRAAARALDEVAALGDRGTDAQRFSIIEALYAGGSPVRADSAATFLATGLETGNTPTPEHDRCTLAQWQAKRGDFPAARHAMSILESSSTADEEVRLEARICARLLRAMVTEPAAAKKKEIASLESTLRTGPAVRYLPAYSAIALADLFARVGDTVSALRASRRRGHYGRWPFYMRTNVELEACFAEAARDSVSTQSARQHLARLAKPVPPPAPSHGID